MKINREELLKVLTIVKAGSTNKEIIEQTDCFAFMGDRIVSYNDIISISHPLDSGITGAISSEELIRLISKMKGKDVEVEMEATEIKLSSGRTKAGLTLQTEIRLPLEEIKDIGKWKTLPTNFAKCVSFAMRACSSDMSRPVLTAVNVTKDGRVEGSDNFRLVRALCNKEIKLDDFLLPAVAAAEVIKLKPTHVAEGQGWVHFKNKEEVVISCRIFEDKYPDIKNLLLVTGTPIEFPSAIMEALERTEIAAKRDHFLDEFVKITIENKKLTLRGESEKVWVEEKTSIKYAGDPISFNIAPYLLRDILKETTTCVVGENMLKFETEEWQYAALIRS